MRNQDAPRTATSPAEERTHTKQREQPTPLEDRLRRLSLACLKARERNGFTGLLGLLAHYVRWEATSGESQTQQLRLIEREIRSVCSRATAKGIAIGIELALTERGTEA